MQLPSLCLAGTALLAQVASSAYLLSSPEPGLKIYGFATLYHGVPTHPAGFFEPGTPPDPPLAINLDAKGNLLGAVRFHRVADGEWELGWRPGNDEYIEGPFAFEDGRFVYKGKGGAVWNACYQTEQENFDGFNIVLSTTASPRPQCIFRDVILEVTEASETT